MKTTLYILLAALLAVQASAFEAVHDYYPGDVMNIRPGEERIFNIQLQNPGETPEEVELVVKANESVTIKTYDASYPVYQIPARTKSGVGRTGVKVVITQPADYEFLLTSKKLSYTNMTDTEGNIKAVSYIPAAAFKLSAVAADNTTRAEPIILAKAIENVSKQAQEGGENNAAPTRDLIADGISPGATFLIALLIAALLLRSRSAGRKDAEEEIVI